jgi:hypothetical protein
MNYDVIRPYSFNLAENNLILNDFSFSSSHGMSFHDRPILNLLSAKYYPASDRFVVYCLEPENIQGCNSSFYRIKFYPTEFKMTPMPPSHFLLSFERNVRGLPLPVMLHSFYTAARV